MNNCQLFPKRIFLVLTFVTFIQYISTYKNNTSIVNDFQGHEGNNGMNKTDVITKSMVNNASVFSLPSSWQDMCYVLEEKINKDDTFRNHMKILCDVSGNTSINFLDFRNLTSNIQENVLFSVTIKCVNGGGVFFPYPGRARLLYSLHISDCILSGFRSEIRDFSIDSISDDIRYFSLKDSIVLNSISDLNDSVDPREVTKAFECGSLNAIEITESNLTDYFTDLLSIPFSQDTVMEKNVDYHRKNSDTSFRCKFPNLRYLDKSFSIGFDRQQLNKQFQNFLYPAVEVMNFSHCGITEIPVQIYDWGLFSKKLKIVDFTHNRISDLGSFTCHSNDDVTGDIFDLRFNNITTVKARSLITIFRGICSQLTINIRNNPFVCDCEIKDLFDFFRRGNYTNISRYRYLLDLTCSNPPSVRGQTISHLSLPEIGCDGTVSKTYLKGPIIGLCCLAFVFSICIIIGVRYKKEIVILAYTRLHILLPCQNYETDDNKKYDAFIAYSQADIYWVINTLAKRLENPETGPKFSLCLHHRDFMVGAAISDNIVRSVENSRHTIIVVSKRFLKSEWCLLEFRTALHQSLLEKKRHLIILLLEDIPTSDFEPELRSCMQTLTYVKSSDCWFWDKLIYALSDWSRKMKNVKANTIKRKIMNENNNVFEGKINVSTVHV